ncbi:MAG: protein YgfX [Paraglaciecola sp.]|uniref:protein YgfX n=1 Tax=Paraglaciecola sp. TaxID=1920173 RepID=UPI0032974800
MLLIQLLTYGGLVVSILIWQPAVIPFQFFLEVLIVTCITFLIFTTVFYNMRQKHAPVTFSSKGEWSETNIDGQVSWKITEKSRVTSFLLFVHLISPINPKRSKWCLVCKDQVTERDFRRLCCAVIYQQQNPRKIR